MTKGPSPFLFPPAHFSHFHFYPIPPEYSRKRAHDPRRGRRRNHARAVDGPFQIHAFNEGEIHNQVGANAEVDADAHHGHVEVAPVLFVSCEEVGMEIGKGWVDE